ncbi:MAG: hypothetical protein IPL53_19530 [Ignavibacteria bacterium]|nr:hypothetical protein [Ignavibacteria bacterium]
MKEMQFNDPEILLVGDENHVFKTTNYGVTWDLLNFYSKRTCGKYHKRNIFPLIESVLL